MKTLDIAAAIFDMDGTLLDTMGLWESAPVELLRERGVACTGRMAAAFHGLGFEAAAEHLSRTYLPQCRPEELMEAIIRRLQRAYEREVQPKPGAETLLRELTGRGLPLALLTANRREMAEAALDRLRWTGYFQTVVTAQEFGASKGEPSIFQHTAALLHAPPERCAVFEDSLAPARAAASLGMPVVAVLDPAAQADWDALRELAAGAVHTLAELPIDFHRTDDISETGRSCLWN